MNVITTTTLSAEQSTTLTSNSNSDNIVNNNIESSSTTTNIPSPQTIASMTLLPTSPTSPKTTPLIPTIPQHDNNNMIFVNNNIQLVVSQMDPIIQKETNKVKAKRIIQQTIIKAKRKTKYITSFLFCLLSFIIVLTTLVTFILCNLFMYPSSYIAVSSKLHLLNLNNELYRKLTKSSTFLWPEMIFPILDFYQPAPVQVIQKNSGPQLIDEGNDNEKQEDKERKRDSHPPFASKEHFHLLKGTHKDRLVEYMDSLKFKTNPKTDFGLDYKNVTFPSFYSESKQLRGWYIPAKTKESNKAIILIHGAFYDRRDVLAHVKYLYPLNVHILLFDLVNHGISDGDEGCSLGYREFWGVLGAIKYMESLIPNVEIALFGTSTGATSAIIAASKSSRVKVVVAENPFAHRTLQIRDVLEVALYKNGWSHQLPKIAAVIIEKIGGFIPKFILNFLSELVNWRMSDFSISNHYHASDMIEQVNIPILFIHSKTDVVVNIKHTELLYSLLKNDQKDFWVVEDAPHSLIHSYLPEKFEKRVLQYLRKHFVN
ncbi:hypothetical protein ABK040_011982 [Willaertia magna]